MHNSQAVNLLPQRWWEYPIEDIAALAPVQKLQWPQLQERGIELAIKRDDLLHPLLSGNKFYKLFAHIQAFKQSHHTQWLTFGGAYSNHLHAFAAVSAQLGIPATAVIRGERPKQLSPTLVDALDMGVALRFVSRSDYRLKHDSQWLNDLRRVIGDFYCIPEGGDGPEGALGCAAWLRQTLAVSPWRPSAICLAAGTGCSAAGVLSAAGEVPVHAYLALKGCTTENEKFAANILHLAKQIDQSPDNTSVLTLESGYHCGGYARFPDFLRTFMLDFERQTGVFLDPVYTAKLFWGLAAQAQAGFWPSGTRLLVMHTGGLQGRRGFFGL